MLTRTQIALSLSRSFFFLSVTWRCGLAEAYDMPAQQHSDESTARCFGDHRLPKREHCGSVSISISTFSCVFRYLNVGSSTVVSSEHSCMQPHLCSIVHVLRHCLGSALRLFHYVVTTILPLVLRPPRSYHPHFATMLVSFRLI